MNPSDTTLWWLAAAVLTVAEMVTGTFYLLMLALGAVAGALAAHAGAPAPLQLLAAALVGGATVAGWHARRRRHARGAPPPARDRALHLDLGERVLVAHWDAHGHALVHYRGAQWQARHAGAAAPAPGEHRISAIEGNRLVLEPVAH